MHREHPEYLVETEWLAASLDDPTLRVLECTAILHPLADGGYRAESGLATWASGHIPRSGFADLTGDLSDRTSPLRFMMPPPEQFAAAMGALGVGDGTRVVLYDRAVNMWAARVWWMLRASGFDDAAVLNGGWRKWTLEGRPVSTDPCPYPPATFVPHPRPQLFADKSAVLAGLGDRATCVVNALTEEQHRGTGGVHYGRPGRIAGSANVAARALVDSTHAYLPLDELRKLFTDSGALASGRVITYCGGGIAASSDAFVLALLGHENVAVYDASLSEWAADPSLPMERG
ncbi:MAG TPA: sulfurtransferase [Methylomirabilota bacterium]|jgi:thiosulfate/3-mercaptopyruvate sulfurtransferase